MGQVGAVQYAIWIILPILQFLIGLAMVRRKLVGTFPVFFAYTIFHFIDQILGVIFFYFLPNSYFTFYWVGELIDAFMTLAVIQEIFTVAFAPYNALRKWAATIFRSLTFLLCVVAALVAVFVPVSETNRTMEALFALDRSVQIVQLGLLVFLFLFCKLFGMTWRHYVFGIAAGFVVMTSIGTAVVAVRAHEGQGGNVWWNLLGPIGFTLGYVVWSYYFASEKSVVALNIVPRTEQLIAWNRALSRVGQR
jgi:hypothetical protein